jgi:prephenate dehydrogenase
MQDKIGVVGAGLIGGSIAAHAFRKGKKVICFGRNPLRLKKALRAGICGEVSTDLSRAGECGMVFLATPVDSIIDLGRKIIPFMKKGSCLTDVGSVKAEICAELFPAAKKRGVLFCGTHPMAGSEKTGFENASPDLFRGSVVFIAKGRNSSARGAELVEKFWKSAGARCVRIEPPEHDALTSAASHLPHLIAFCFAEFFSRFEKKHPGARRACAGSFESVTRTAASSPLLWSAVFAQNRKNLLRHARDFRKSLDRMILTLEKKRSALKNIEKIKRDFEQCG